MTRNVGRKRVSSSTAVLALALGLACAGCSRPGAEVPQEAVASVSSTVSAMPSPAATGEAAFASAEDAKLLLSVHRVAARLADKDHRWTPRECADLSDDLGEVATPNDVLAAANRVKDPTLRMLWWNERRATGQAVAACAGNRTTRDALVAEAGSAVALVQSRLDEMEIR